MLELEVEWYHCSCTLSYSNYKMGNRQKHIAEMNIKLYVASVVLTGHFKNITGSVQRRNLHIHTWSSGSQF